MRCRRSKSRLTRWESVHHSILLRQSLLLTHLLLISPNRFPYYTAYLLRYTLLDMREQRQEAVAMAWSDVFLLPAIPELFLTYCSPHRQQTLILISLKLHPHSLSNHTKPQRWHNASYRTRSKCRQSRKSSLQHVRHLPRQRQPSATQA